MREQRGFTTTELLVVIAVIGILVGLIIPAIQSARESARKANCSNNIRQLCMGVLNFEGAYRNLPVGVVSMNPTTPVDARWDYKGMTWITQTLPFLEQNALWERTLGEYRTQPIPFGAHLGMSSILPVVCCPSDPASGIVHRTHRDYFVATTDYLGVNGINFLSRDGVFTYDRPVRLREIGDGLSNTLMIGERPPSKDYWYGWWYASGSGQYSTGDALLGIAELNPAYALGTPTFFQDCPIGPTKYLRGSNNQCDALHYWSYHPLGAAFAKVDGSVSFIGYSVDSTVMRSLSTRSGGEVIETSSY